MWRTRAAREQQTDYIYRAQERERQATAKPPRIITYIILFVLHSNMHRTLILFNLRVLKSTMDKICQHCSQALTFQDERPAANVVGTRITFSYFTGTFAITSCWSFRRFEIIFPQNTRIRGVFFKMYIVNDYNPREQ